MERTLFELKANENQQLLKLYRLFDTTILKAMKNSNLTLLHINKETGVSRTTLRKIRDGEEGCTYNLTPYKRYKLFNCFFSVEQINLHYSHFSPLFDSEEPIKNNSESKSSAGGWDSDLSTNHVFNEIFAKEMRDPMAISIYTQSLESGLAKKDLVSNFGNFGISIAEKLVRANILAFHNEKYIAINSSYVDIDKNKVKDIVTSLSQNYNPSHCGQEKNWINFRTAKISESAIKRIQDLHAQLSNQIQEILSEPESKGSIPFYSINQMDTFEP